MATAYQDKIISDLRKENKMIKDINKKWYVKLFKMENEITELKKELVKYKRDAEIYNIKRKSRTPN